MKCKANQNSIENILLTESIVVSFCKAIIVGLCFQKQFYRYNMEELTKEQCTKSLLPIRDALDVINGKWKLHIIGSLLHGKRRFKDLQRDINGITAKMLSQELKSLEVHGLVSRTVFDTSPIVVEYALTPYGTTLKKLMDELRIWGTEHRNRIIGPTK